MIKKSYQAPPPLCQPGEEVLFYGGLRRVVVSSHTHTRLTGIEYAVPNWELTLFNKDLYQRYWSETD